MRGGIAFGLATLLVSLAGCSVLFDGGGSVCRDVEFCNGLDDNCDGEIDEVGCGPGCFGAARGGDGHLFCQDGLPREEAQARCGQSEMELVEILDADHNMWLVDRAMEESWPVAEFRAGGADAEAEGDWQWESGERFWEGGSGGLAQGGRFVSWAPNQPDNGGGDEDCLDVYISFLNAAPGRWNDSSCDISRAYVCGPRR